VGQLDSGLLNDLECEAQKMATSIDNLTENLCGILHSISSITADNVDVYKNAVSKMSDAMDSNIKSMYTMMAKTEEVTQAMKSVQTHATRIKEIKRLVDLFESYV
jgi:methyl-accepting chemotaxis protein